MSNNTLANASLNAFSVQPSEDQLITVPASLLESLQGRIEALEGMVDFQGKEIKALRATQPGITASRVDDAFEAIRDIDEHLARIDRAKTTAPPRGEKTLDRINKIDTILKARGPTTLKELERILGIDQATMTRLLGKLDKRRYEVHSRPGDDREKVLRLKVQIR